MYGGDSAPTDRGVSDIFGVVLLVSLTLIGSLLLVAVGGMALQAIADQTQSDVAQQSMQEMSSRLSGVADSPVDASTKFEFPQGVGEDVTLNATGASFELAMTNRSLSAAASPPACSYSSKLGTVYYTDSQNSVYAYQGGGVWAGGNGGASMVSPPELDYDGNTIDFSLVNVSRLESIDENKQVVATKDVQASQRAAQRLQNEFRPCWTNSTDGTMVTVNATLTIESEFAGAWATYANDSMRVSPHRVQYWESNDTVRMTFLNVGSSVAGAGGGGGGGGGNGGSGGSNVDDALEEEGDALRVFQNQGTLELLSAQIGAPVEREVVVEDPEYRDPMDVMFAIDETGSMTSPSEGDEYTISFDGHDPDPSLDWIEGCRDGSPPGCDEYEVKHYDNYRIYYNNGSGWKAAYWVRHGWRDWSAYVPTDGRIVTYERNGTYDVGAQDPDGLRIDATRSYIGELNGTHGDRAGVVQFSSDFSGGSVVKHGLSNDLEAVNQSFSAHGDGGTDISDGMADANDEFESHSSSDNDRVMIVMSDGYNSQVSSNLDVMRETRRAIEQNVTVYTIGLGPGVDEDLLKWIANESNGSYVHVDNAAQLDDAFDDIADETQTQTVRMIQRNATQMTARHATTEPINIDLNDPSRSFSGNDGLSLQNDTMLSFELTLQGCEEWQFTGVTDDDASGTSWEHATCETPDPDSTVTVSNTSSVHGEQVLLVDGESTSPLGTIPVDWWQKDPEDVLQNEGFTHSNGTVDLPDNEAVVAMTVESGTHEGYVLLHFNVPPRNASPGSSEPDVSAQPSAPIDIDYSEVTFS